MVLHRFIPSTTASAQSSLLVGCVALCCVLGLVAMAPAVAADNHQAGNQTYAVSQGENCTTVTPLGIGVESVEAFYDYRTPQTRPNSSTYSSYGTRHLQENDTSVMFLYQGTNGTALGFVHDKLRGGTSGGAVTMEIQGLPSEGEWVVQDDSYNETLAGGPTDSFERAGSASRVSWTYDEGRTDGAVFQGGLDGDFSISISPAFNEDADFTDRGGEITDWQVISDSPAGHERHSLSMDQPVTIEPGRCVDFSFHDVNTTAAPSVGEPVQVRATVRNDGAQAQSSTVRFSVDGEVVDEQSVTLEPGEETVATSTVEFNTTGTHTVSVGDQTTEISVAEAEAPVAGVGVDDIPLPVVGAALGAVALLAVGLLIRRRR